MSKKVIRLEDYELCGPGYKDGYEDGYQNCMNEVEEKYQLAKKNQLYFRKQRLFGGLLLFLTAILVKLLDGDATIALFMVPLSAILIFSKEKWTYFEGYEEKNYDN